MVNGLFNQGPELITKPLDLRVSETSKKLEKKNVENSKNDENPSEDTSSGRGSGSGCCSQINSPKEKNPLTNGKYSSLINESSGKA